MFHAGEYDLYVLKRDCGFKFANLFDTMISAQLLGYPAIGLAALIEHHFGVRLPKDEQRSDWSRRPLTEKQLEYAASDVLYLIRLHEKLEKELRKAGSLSWAQAEFERSVDAEWPEREFDRLGYLRIKGARRLDPTELAMLRELFLMRDARAREIDRPPFKVLGNRTLLEIAREQPTDHEALARIKGVTDLIIRRLGKDITPGRQEGPQQAARSDSEARDDRSASHGSPHRATPRASSRSWRGPRAKELGLDPGILCPNAALEAIAISNPTSREEFSQVPELKSWFAANFAEEIIPVLDDTSAPTETTPSTRRRRRR